MQHIGHMTDRIEAEIFNQLAALAPGKSIEPADVAKVLQPDRWQRQLARVKTVAIGLMRQGRLTITKKGKPVDPASVKGVIRLRLPTEAEAQSAQAALLAQVDAEPFDPNPDELA